MQRVEDPCARERAAPHGMGWLLETMNQLLRCHSVAALLDLAYDAVRDGLGYDRVGLQLIDPSRRALVEHIGTDAAGRKFYPRDRRSPLDGDGYHARLLADPRLRADGPGFIYMADAWREMPPAIRRNLDGRPGQSLRIALRTADTVAGLLCVDNLTSGRLLTQDDAPPLVAFATALAMALENARLLEGSARDIDALHTDLERRVAELEWLRDISRRVTEARTRAKVLDVVYEGVRIGLGYDRVGINLFDHAAGVFEDCIGTDAAGRTTRPMDRAVGLAQDSPIWRFPGIAALLRGAEFYYTADANAECPPELRYLFDGAPAHNLMIPLRCGEQVSGIISVDNLVSGRPITPRDAGPLLALANQVGTAVENARLLEQERGERARLATMATTDALTGLPNRTLLHDRLAQALRVARRESGPLALLLLDLDRFKEVNDTLGHHIGDRLLQAVGPRIAGLMRATDTVARLGGDEFAVVLPGSAEAAATGVARSLCAALATPFEVEGHILQVGVSVGIALAPAHGLDGEALLRHADVAMYTAKRTRTGHALYDPTQDRYSTERLALIGALRDALADKTLELAYQPQVDVARGRVCGVEALARWTHPEFGPIPPDQFIPLAEHSGMIAPLTAWVLEATLCQWRRWHDAGLLLGVAVNLSVWNLHDPDLPDMVARLLRRYGVPAAWLRLELTESVLMADPERSMAVLARLAALGVRLAVDDYGTGYSSLAYLKRLPVDELKIDKAFVRHLASDEADAAIVASTIGLARSLGLRVVAEGVEDQASWELLAEMGCDRAQGYYLAHPLPADELERWLREAPWASASA